LGRFLLLNSGSAEYGGYHRIPLVAGPLVDRPLRLRHRNLCGPRFGPGGGIFGGELVRDRIVGTAREAFHQMQLLAGSSEGASSSEIGRVNHQRIAVPMANRVSLPLADSLRDMRAPVGGDDARGVIDLVKKSHVSRPLHNLEKVTLAGCGKHRDHLLAHQNTTLRQRPVLVTVEFVSLVFRGTFGVSLFGLWKHGRNHALRSHNQRCSFVGCEPGLCDVKTTVQTDVVTESVLSSSPEFSFLANIALPDTLRQLGKFLVRIKLFGAQPFRPLQGSYRGGGPYSL